MGKPRVLLVADGRSPITRNWIKMLQSGGYSICLASTYPYQPIEGLEKQALIPVGFSAFAGGQVGAKGAQSGLSLRRLAIGLFRPFLMRARAELAPRLMQTPRKKLLNFIRTCQPDIVHALRIPYEGILCSTLSPEIPLVVSIWGNDLTLHAKSSALVGRLTRQTLARADALLADASRDITLAQGWGLSDGTPTAVVPGSGGLNLSTMDACRSNAGVVMDRYHIPHGRALVINPRGFRPGSVHQDVFFKSIPIVMKKMPSVYFVCPGMQGQAIAKKWIQNLEISHAVKLLPFLSQEELWALYTASSVYISLSSHDGTPNSFLEAMACGAYPVVGDIDSLREWIIPGENGSLIDPTDASRAAQEIYAVLGDENLRHAAAQKNRDLVEQRALRNEVLKKVDVLYTSLC